MSLPQIPLMTKEFSETNPLTLPTVPSMSLGKRTSSLERRKLSEPSEENSSSESGIDIFMNFLDSKSEDSSEEEDEEDGGQNEGKMMPIRANGIILALINK